MLFWSEFTKDYVTMALSNKRSIDLQGILFLVFLTLSVAATTNIDCKGKPFHCVNSTHFMICVDLGGGLSSTIDNYIIPCPPTTVCQGNNRFECEFPAATIAPPLPQIDVKNQVTTSGTPVMKYNEITTVPSITGSGVLQENFNTVSLTTLSDNTLKELTTQEPSTVINFKNGLQGNLKDLRTNKGIEKAIVSNINATDTKSNSFSNVTNNFAEINIALNQSANAFETINGMKENILNTTKNESSVENSPHGHEIVTEITNLNIAKDFVNAYEISNISHILQSTLDGKPVLNGKVIFGDATTYWPGIDQNITEQLNKTNSNNPTTQRIIVSEGTIEPIIKINDSLIDKQKPKIMTQKTAVPPEINITKAITNLFKLSSDIQNATFNDSFVVTTESVNVILLDMSTNSNQSMPEVVKSYQNFSDVFTIMDVTTPISLDTASPSDLLLIENVTTGTERSNTTSKSPTFSTELTSPFDSAKITKKNANEQNMTHEILTTLSTLLLSSLATTETSNTSTAKTASFSSVTPSTISPTNPLTLENTQTSNMITSNMTSLRNGSDITHKVYLEQSAIPIFFMSTPLSEATTENILSTDITSTTNQNTIQFNSTHSNIPTTLQNVFLYGNTNISVPEIASYSTLSSPITSTTNIPPDTLTSVNTGQMNTRISKVFTDNIKNIKHSSDIEGKGYTETIELMLFPISSPSLVAPTENNMFTDNFTITNQNMIQLNNANGAITTTTFQNNYANKKVTVPNIASTLPTKNTLNSLNKVSSTSSLLSDITNKDVFTESTTQKNTIHTNLSTKTIKNISDSSDNNITVPKISSIPNSSPETFVNITTSNILPINNTGEMTKTLVINGNITERIITGSISTTISTYLPLATIEPTTSSLGLLTLLEENTEKSIKTLPNDTDSVNTNLYKQADKLTTLSLSVSVSENIYSTHNTAATNQNIIQTSYQNPTILTPQNSPANTNRNVEPIITSPSSTSSFGTTKTMNFQGEATSTSSPLAVATTSVLFTSDIITTKTNNTSPKTTNTVSANINNTTPKMSTVSTLAISPFTTPSILNSQGKPISISLPLPVITTENGLSMNRTNQNSVQINPNSTEKTLYNPNVNNNVTVAELTLFSSLPSSTTTEMSNISPKDTASTTTDHISTTIANIYFNVSEQNQTESTSFSTLMPVSFETTEGVNIMSTEISWQNIHELNTANQNNTSSPINNFTNTSFVSDTLDMNKFTELPLLNNSKTLLMNVVSPTSTTNSIITTDVFTEHHTTSTNKYDISAAVADGKQLPIDVNATSVKDNKIAYVTYASSENITRGPTVTAAVSMPNFEVTVTTEKTQGKVATQQLTDATTVLPYIIENTIETTPIEINEQSLIPSLSKYNRQNRSTTKFENIDEIPLPKSSSLLENLLLNSSSSNVQNTSMNRSLMNIFQLNTTENSLQNTLLHVENTITTTMLPNTDFFSNSTSNISNLLPDLPNTNLSTKTTSFNESYTNNNNALQQTATMELNKYLNAPSVNDSAIETQALTMTEPNTNIVFSSSKSMNTSFGSNTFVIPDKVNSKNVSFHRVENNILAKLNIRPALEKNVSFHQVENNIFAKLNIRPALEKNITTSPKTYYGNLASHVTELIKGDIVITTAKNILTTATPSTVVPINQTIFPNDSETINYIGSQNLDPKTMQNSFVKQTRQNTNDTKTSSIINEQTTNIVNRSFNIPLYTEKTIKTNEKPNTTTSKIPELQFVSGKAISSTSSINFTDKHFVIPNENNRLPTDHTTTPIKETVVSTSIPSPQNLNVNSTPFFKTNGNVTSSLAFTNKFTIETDKVVTTTASTTPAHFIVPTENVIKSNTKSNQESTINITVVEPNHTIYSVNTKNLSDAHTIFSVRSGTINIINDRPPHEPTVSTTGPLENKTAIAKSHFVCQSNTRGRYADNENCRKFYICIGKRQPIVGSCPLNTVFSEIRKQCTRNLSHCIRNNQFHCSTEGRFSDVLIDNIYYICVKTSPKNFVRFKLQCLNGYHLNKTAVRCIQNNEISSQSESSNSDSYNNSDQSAITAKDENHRESKTDFVCKEEGKFADPNNCRKYYVCSKNNKSEYRRKIKMCDSDEIFHNDKKKCVEDESYECN